MTQQRLNHCMLLHVHVTHTDELNLKEVGKEFVLRNDWRKILWAISNIKIFTVHTWPSALYMFLVKYNIT